MHVIVGAIDANNVSHGETATTVSGELVVFGVGGGIVYSIAVSVVGSSDSVWLGARQDSCAGPVYIINELLRPATLPPASGPMLAPAFVPAPVPTQPEAPMLAPNHTPLPVPVKVPTPEPTPLVPDAVAMPAPMLIPVPAPGMPAPVALAPTPAATSNVTSSNPGERPLGGTPNGLPQPEAPPGSQEAGAVALLPKEVQPSAGGTALSLDACSQTAEGRYSMRTKVQFQTKG